MFKQRIYLRKNLLILTTYVLVIMQVLLQDFEVMLFC
jgi:hypothetical protein